MAIVEFFVDEMNYFQWNLCGRKERKVATCALMSVVDACTESAHSCRVFALISSPKTFLVYSFTMRLFFLGWGGWC